MASTTTGGTSYTSSSLRNHQSLRLSFPSERVATASLPFFFSVLNPFASTPLPGELHAIATCTAASLLGAVGSPGTTLLGGLWVAPGTPLVCAWPPKQAEPSLMSLCENLFLPSLSMMIQFPRSSSL